MSAPVIEPAFAASSVEQAVFHQSALEVLSIASSRQELLNGHADWARNDGAAILRGMPGLVGETELGDAFADGVPAVVIGLHELPVISAPKTRVGLAHHANVVRDSALRDSKRSRDLCLRHALRQHPEHSVAGHIRTYVRGSSGRSTAASPRGSPSPGEKPSRPVQVHECFAAVGYPVSRDTVRDSPIGSDARFWSGRLGFESLSRSWQVPRHYGALGVSEVYSGHDSGQSCSGLRFARPVATIEISPLFASAAGMRGRLRAAFAHLGVPIRGLVDDPLSVRHLVRELTGSEGSPSDWLVERAAR
jgi:hypothetical protein